MACTQHDRPEKECTEPREELKRAKEEQARRSERREGAGEHADAHVTDGVPASAGLSKLG